MNNTVWTFTNKKELNRSQFIDYFERKVFKTIRKYEMLPKNKSIKLKKSTDINTKVLKKIIEKKFEVKFDTKPNFSSENLTDATEEIFGNILRGEFSGPTPKNKPLYFLSDKEVALYARLTNIKGLKKKRDKKIQVLFEKFLKKNQDLELNIVKSMTQIR
jgi:hypothetical protein